MSGHAYDGIRSDGPCDCPPGQCAAFVEPDTDCIHRLTGDVAVWHCDACGAGTWHQDGQCIRCRGRVSPGRGAGGVTDG